MSDQDDNSNDVGYGKPPKHAQFKKGQSGNPSGRRKRDKPVTDPNPVREVLLEEIVTTTKGTKKKMSIVQALAKKYVGMAMNGDHKAAKLLFDHCGGVDTLLCWKPGKADK